MFHILAEYNKGHERLFHFGQEVNQQRTDLLIQYGHLRNPHYPFWRLANDKGNFWEIKNGENCRVTSQGDPSKKDLIELNVMVAFDSTSFQELLSKPKYIEEIASNLIPGDFLETLQDELL